MKLNAGRCEIIVAMQIAVHVPAIRTVNGPANGEKWSMKMSRDRNNKWQNNKKKALTRTTLRSPWRCNSCRVYSWTLRSGTKTSRAAAANAGMDCRVATGAFALWTPLWNGNCSLRLALRPLARYRPMRHSMWSPCWCICPSTLGPVDAGTAIAFGHPCCGPQISPCGCHSASRRAGPTTWDHRTIHCFRLWERESIKLSMGR